MVLSLTLNAENNTTTIVSLQPAVTDNLIRLGGKSSLVGISTYCDELNNRSGKIPKVGDLYNMNLEQIIRLRPDVLFLHISQSEQIEKLKAVNIEAIPVKTDTMQDVKETLQKCYQQIPHTHNADKLMKTFTEFADGIKNIKDVSLTSKTLMIVAHDGNRFPVYAVTPNSYHGAILTGCRLRNVIPETVKMTTIPLSAEEVIKLDPEIIIDLDVESDKDAYNIFRILSTVSAVRDRYVFGLKSKAVLLPGLSCLDACTTISKKLNEAGL